MKRYIAATPWNELCGRKSRVGHKRMVTSSVPRNPTRPEIGEWEGLGDRYG
jgi:hypothetical protein